MDLGGEHRLQIDRWYYQCSKEMHANLGDMYAADERFGAFCDAYEPGLEIYVRDAIAANGRRPERSDV